MYLKVKLPDVYMELDNERTLLVVKFQIFH